METLTFLIKSVVVILLSASLTTTAPSINNEFGGRHMRFRRHQPDDSGITIHETIEKLDHFGNVEEIIERDKIVDEFGNVKEIVETMEKLDAFGNVEDIIQTDIKYDAEGNVKEVDQKEETLDAFGDVKEFSETKFKIGSDGKIEEIDRIEEKIDPSSGVIIQFKDTDIRLVNGQVAEIHIKQEENSQSHQQLSEKLEDFDEFGNVREINQGEVKTDYFGNIKEIGEKVTRYNEDGTVIDITAIIVPAK